MWSFNQQYYVILYSKMMVPEQKNKFELIYEMFHIIIELRIWNQVSYGHRNYERNLSNYVQKPEKVRTSTGFESPF